MLEIRIHGRGGQGVVSAAELLSVAAFLEGKYAQAFPSFGSERMGAPVMSFCRIDDKPIRVHEPVMRPDVLVIQDPTLLHQVTLFDGLIPSGCVFINTARTIESLGLDDLLSAHPQLQLRTVPASELALRFLKRPIPNAPLLGAFAAITGVVRLESVISALSSKFKGAIGQSNADAARAGFDFVRQHDPAAEVANAAAD